MNESQFITDERQLEFSELLPGDILVFRAEKEDAVSLAISYLTDSDVSHSGIYLGLNNKGEAFFADEGALGLRPYIMKPNLKGQPVYVRRLKDICDIKPVLLKAQSYLHDTIPCDWTSLVLLALILLYKKIPVYKYPEKIITKVLLVAASAIDEYLSQKNNTEKELMICSQFVFCCFEEASKLEAKYKLDLYEDRYFKSSSSKEPNLIRRIFNEIHKSSRVIEFNAVEFEDTYSDIESEIALWVKLQRKKTFLLENKRTFELHNDLIAAVILFSDKWYELRFGERSLSSFEKLNRNAVDYNRSLFITPADLKLHMKNLDPLGWIPFDRMDE